MNKVRVKLNINNAIVKIKMYLSNICKHKPNYL